MSLVLSSVLFHVTFLLGAMSLCRTQALLWLCRAELVGWVPWAELGPRGLCRVDVLLPGLRLHSSCVLQSTMCVLMVLGKLSSKQMATGIGI